MVTSDHVKKMAVTPFDLP